MRSRRSAFSVLITASLAAVAGTAQAVVHEVSTRNKLFCCTNVAMPLVLLPPGMGGYHFVTATASVSGTGTPAIKVGMGRVARFYSMATTQPPAISLKTIKRVFSISNGPGTLEKSGGNLASFSFCPKAKGPGPGACTDPSQATPAHFNGRIKLTPGPNKFGGTLQILAGPAGLGGSKNTVYRYLGGPSMSQPPVQIVRFRLPLSPIGAMTPGKFGMGTQTIDHGYSFLSGGLAGGSVGPDTHGGTVTSLWQNGAGRFTTGMLTIHISKNNFPPNRSVMLTGFDTRTPMGAGNIQLVSGILSNRNNPSSPGSSPLVWSMRLNFAPEPAPGLGLAAGALALLGVGCARARRRPGRGE